jgi:hypothetical protein
LESLYGAKSNKSKPHDNKEEGKLKDKLKDVF